MGRTQALDPAAFLVDQHRRIGPADRLAQLAHQRPNLVRRFDIARKQDEAQRVEAGEKIAAPPPTGEAGATQDDRARRQARRVWNAGGD